MEQQKKLNRGLCRLQHLPIHVATYTRNIFALAEVCFTFKLNLRLLKSIRSFFLLNF